MVAVVTEACSGMMVGDEEVFPWSVMMHYIEMNAAKSA